MKKQGKPRHTVFPEKYIVFLPYKWDKSVFYFLFVLCVAVQFFFEKFFLIYKAVCDDERVCEENYEREY